MIELLLYALTPAVAILIWRRERMSWLDPVWTCYGVGLLMALSPMSVDDQLAKSTTEAVVPLAIPLMLFRTDVKAWLAQSRVALLAFAFAVSTVVASALTVGMIFAPSLPEVHYVAGMMTATLTGGSPNLVSVGAALETPEEIFVLTNAADIITGGVYLLFLLTIAQPVLGKILRAPEDVIPLELDEGELPSRAARVKEGALAVALSLLIVAISAGLALLITGKLEAPLVFLGLTTGGLAASFFKPVRELKTSFSVANYLVLIFCVAIGSLTDLGAILSEGGMILSFAAVMVISALVLHYALCALFRVDVDTAILASTASFMGPALVIPVARRIDNQQAFVSGLTSGLIGYALGNYLGISVAYLINALVA